MVIVFGHYGCGGIAALSDQQYGLIDNWLGNIKDVMRHHYIELSKITDPSKKQNRLVELNIMNRCIIFQKHPLFKIHCRRGMRLSWPDWYMI